VTIEDYIKENPAFQYMEYFVTPGAASEMNGMVREGNVKVKERVGQPSTDGLLPPMPIL